MVYAGDFDGCGGSYALTQEVVLSAPNSGVAVDLRGSELDDGADAVAALEGMRSGLGCIGSGPTDCEADVSGDGCLEIGGVGDDF